VAALHVPAPADAPVNPVRGHPIDQLGARLTANLEALELDQEDEVRDRWAELADTPAWGGPPLWIHGDLHSANVLVAPAAGGVEITAVIDFGDIAGADPAVDLAIGWMLFDPPARTAFRTAAGQGRYPVDDAMWRRAEAWALHFAVVYLANSADDQRLARIGRRSLAAVLT
jgi:aminoglycoside phosphotransferase (APT) family kinase protein